MRLLSCAALFTTAIIFSISLHASAAQSNSPHGKSAQATLRQSAAAPADDSTKKLGVFFGKWETEGAFTNGPKNLYHSGMPLVAARLISRMRSTGQDGRGRESSGSSPCTRMTARPGSILSPRWQIPTQSQLQEELPSTAISGLTMIPALPRMVKPLWCGLRMNLLTQRRRFLKLRRQKITARTGKLCFRAWRTKLPINCAAIRSAGPRSDPAETL
jgi:hypothetical protein